MAMNKGIIGKWSLSVFVAAVTLAVLAPAPSNAEGGGSTCNNTTRHIYNQSRCNIGISGKANAGGWHCLSGCGGDSGGTIAARGSAEFEMTTTGCISQGDISVTGANTPYFHYDIQWVMGSKTTENFTCMSPMGASSGSFNQPGCGTVYWKINSPAKIDIKFCDGPC